MQYFVNWFVGFQLFEHLLSLAVVAIVVVVVTSARNEPDPHGRRVAATFLGAVLFVSLLGAVGASTAAVGEIGAAVQDDGEEFDIGDEELMIGGGFEQPGRGDNYADALQAALLAGAAVVVFAYHRRKLDVLLTEPDAGAVVRIAEGYRYLVVFLAVGALAIGAALAVSGLVKAAVPDLFSVEDDYLAQRVGLATFMVGAWLTGVGYVVFNLHERPDEPPAEEPPIP